MDFKSYQKKAKSTAVYPQDFEIVYPALGLAGECGEVIEKIKKQIRDDNCDFTNAEFIFAVAKELGDVLWYVSNLASDLGIDLDDIVNYNVKKLSDRKKRGKLKGSGDQR